MTRVNLDFEQIFERVPYPAVVVDPKLAVLVANAEARRLLDAGTGHLKGMLLFDVLPTTPGDSEWLERLRASYARVLVSNQAVSVSFPLRASRDASPALAEALSGSGRRAAGIWQVRHSPVRNAQGALEAIATYAVRVDAAEHALAQRGSEVSPSAVLEEIGEPIVLSDIGTRAAQPAAGSDSIYPQGHAAAPPGTPSTGRRIDAVAAPCDGKKRALRILLVEDSADLRETTADQLRALGHLVTSCADAEQALQQLETDVFDLLFTDLTLPKMTGAELARQVLQRYNPMRVVIASGYGRAMANVQTLDAQFLAKPYRFAELETVIKEVSQRLTG